MAIRGDEIEVVKESKVRAEVLQVITEAKQWHRSAFPRSEARRKICSSHENEIKKRTKEDSKKLSRQRDK
jgi:hypothetical protein